MFPGPEPHLLYGQREDGRVAGPIPASAVRVLPAELAKRTSTHESLAPRSVYEIPPRPEDRYPELYAPLRQSRRRESFKW